MNETHGLNLTTHRASGSVWERRGWDGTRGQLATTRWLLGVGGGALALQGLRQRSVMGSVLAGIGGSLAWWALTGEGDLSDARRWFGKSPNAPAGAVKISCTTRRPIHFRRAIRRRGPRRSAPA